MRITNASQRNQLLRDVQGNLARVAELQRQISSGKRFSRVEQDPLAASQVLRVERGTRALDQYAKNGTEAQIRLGAEEAVVKQIDELLREGRDFALGFAKGDPPYTADQLTQRQAATDHLTRLIDQIVSLGNTRIGSEYILAGELSTTEPFDTTPGATYGDYQGGTRARQIEIADNVFIAPNHTGDQSIGPALTALTALRDAADPANLQTEAQVQAAVQTVFDASQGLQLSLAETGTTGSQVAKTLRSNAVLKNGLADVRAAVEAVSMEEAIAKLLSLQTTIEASYNATSRMISLSLTDYLG